jgi:transposase-like protein
MAYPRDVSIAQAIKQYGLPKSHRAHWSPARKAGVVRAVHERAISFHEARERYLLSRSEFEEWERDYTQGTSALRASRLESA